MPRRDRGRWAGAIAFAAGGALSGWACAAPDGDGVTGDDSQLVVDESRDTNGIHRARMPFSHEGRTGYAFVEILDDDLAHVEFGVGDGPPIGQPLATSPLVYKHDYRGPSHVTQTGHTIETPAMRLDMNASGCITVTDTANGRNRFLTTTCPVKLFDAWKGMSLDPHAMENAYGLGQSFVERGSADGDWKAHGRFSTDGFFGNNFKEFWGGANGQIQFPVLYAVGQNNDDFGILLDSVYKQDWNFTGDPWWQIRTFGDTVRFFVMTGPDLADIRSDYMELTGTPPVPPKKAFGLWLSQFGFKDWSEVDRKIGDLRSAKFPVDGFVLDIQWFGGTDPNKDDSAMGGLSWDQARFVDEKNRIAGYARQNLGVITIEESYVSQGQPGFATMKARNGLALRCGTSTPVDFSNWMGHTSMIDWSNRDAAAWWHDNVRSKNLITNGVIGHWTDLGEPERFDGDACYQGAVPGKTTHSDVHNIYNLLWHESIFEGYVRNHCERGGADCTTQRPFMLSRAGAPGIQRYGAAMWSGDIASRLDVLATHENVAMHMSFAGIDYYGSDVGGFWRPAMNGQNSDLQTVMPPDTNVVAGYRPWEPEMYMQWFANAAWFDVPLRPHVFNCGFSWFTGAGCPDAKYESSPAKMVGNATQLASNLENLRQRYELVPYYYSLAHGAFDAGTPLIAPVVLYYQNDEAVRQMGSERLLGRDMLVGVVATQGQTTRTMVLPKGDTWIDYHTGEVFPGGITTPPRSLYIDGVFRLPVFVRAGSIIPAMVVDDATTDVFDHRADGTTHDDLVVKVFAEASRPSSSFTLYEDDGKTVAGYEGGDPRSARPHYDRRTTVLQQSLAGDTLTVTIAAASGSYAGAVATRNNQIRLVVPGKAPASIRVDGAPATFRSEGAAFVVDTGLKSVSAAKVVEVKLR